MTPEFDTQPFALDAPARRAEAVTPSDNADLPNASRSLFIGGAGNLQITTVGGDTVTLVGASGFIPICVARVHAASTTATSIVALW